MTGSGRLSNADLDPVPPPKRTWRTYDVFAMWMSDVHSVGGYVFAAGLFATGLTGWQVLAAMVAGILLVYWLMNLIGRPSQRLGIPYPVMARVAFGVFGANLPALARALVGIVWYGVQTHFAAMTLKLVLLRFFPELAPWSHDANGFAGLSWLGWGCYLSMWLLQLALFYRGMESIRRFADFAGPAVYLVMFLLAGWIVLQVGVDQLSISLTDQRLTGMAAWLAMVNVAALVVGYFSAMLLNFGDFSRYCPSEREMIRGNRLGLPLNWLLFALLTVIVTSGTVSLFGEPVMDPVEIVARLDNVTAALLGAATFIVATIGINLVANFVSPAFDLANLAPVHLSFRRGGLLAAGATLFTLPWHFVESPQAMAVFVGTIGGFLGPLYGIIVADYYLVTRRDVPIADLYSTAPNGRFWYIGGWNPRAIAALVPAACLSAVLALWSELAAFRSVSWFLSAGLAAALYLGLQRRAQTARSAVSFGDAGSFRDTGSM